MTEIRAVRAGDRQQWARLFVDYGVFYKTAFDESIVEGVWRWLLEDAAIHGIVAVVDDAVAGFALFRSVPDTFTAASGWFLDDLYVAPKHRGAGIATALIHAVSDYAGAHGGGTLRWITADDNLTAQSVYDKLARRAAWVTYERETP